MLKPLILDPVCYTSPSPICTSCLYFLVFIVYRRTGTPPSTVPHVSVHFEDSCCSGKCKHLFYTLFSLCNDSLGERRSSAASLTSTGPGVIQGTMQDVWGNLTTVTHVVRLKLITCVHNMLLFCPIDFAWRELKAIFFHHLTPCAMCVAEMCAPENAGGNGSTAYDQTTDVDVQF